MIAHTTVAAEAHSKRALIAAVAEPGACARALPVDFPRADVGSADGGPAVPSSTNTGTSGSGADLLERGDAPRLASKPTLAGRRRRTGLRRARPGV